MVKLQRYAVPTSVGPRQPLAKLMPCSGFGFSPADAQGCETNAPVNAATAVATANATAIWSLSVPVSRRRSLLVFIVATSNFARHGESPTGDEHTFPDT